MKNSCSFLRETAKSEDTDMTKLSDYNNTLSRVELYNGEIQTGPCEYFNPDYGLHVFDYQMDGLKVGDLYVFADMIKEIELIRREVCIPVREWIEAKEEIAEWFHNRWNIPLEVYRESIRHCIREEAPVPQWYVVVRQNDIIAGCGVIANDFHERKDLTPNVCAVYVDEEYRNQGVAGFMLEYVCRDMAELGIDTLYLLTDHTGFYEKYGWEFFSMVRGDDGKMSRMYVHRM